MTSSERSILGVTFVGHALCHCAVLIVTGIFVTLQREFGLSDFWVTALPVIGYVLMGVGAVPAGMIADRWGARRVLLLYFVLVAAACAGAAGASNAWALGAALTLLGAAVSLYHPTGLAMISHGIQQRGRALGIHGVAGSLGLAGGAYGMLLDDVWNWRAAYGIVAVVALVAAVGLAVSPIRHGQAEPHVHRPAVGPKRAFDRRRLIRLLLLLYVAMMLSGFNYRSLMTALPTYLGKSGAPGLGRSMTYESEPGALALLFAVCLVAGVGQYVAGYYADRARAVVLYVSLAATTVPMAILLGLSGGGTGWATAAALGLVLFHFAQQPVENLLIAKHTPANLRSTSYGIKFLVTFGVGALGAPAVGAVWQATGSFAGVFFLFAGVAVVVSTILLVVVRVVAAAADTDAGAPAAGLPVATSKS